MELRSVLKEDDSVLFYTSPYLRTRQTLDGLISGLEGCDVDYKVHEEPRMREQDFGNFQASSDEMEKIWTERAHYGHFFYRIPFGESAADVYDRCAGFNETLFRQFQSDKFPSVLVLVTHGIWARVFLMKWYRWTYEEFESLKNVPHCQLITMERPPDTHKFTLKTTLHKWEEDDDDCAYLEESKTDVTKNSNSYTDMSALNQYDDGRCVSRDDEIRREKERKLREMFDKARGEYKT